jgi:hypothetical protein
VDRAGSAGLAGACFFAEAASASVADATNAKTRVHTAAENFIM